MYNEAQQVYFQIKSVKNKQNTKHKKYKPVEEGTRLTEKQSKYCL